MRMRVALLAGTVLAGALVGPRAAVAKLPPCPGGDYLVLDGPILAGGDASQPDRILVAGRMVSIASHCAAMRSRVRATRLGTKITTRFPLCTGVGRAVMKGIITESCHTFTGSIRFTALHLVKPLVAHLSYCGDGIWDAARGEECDGALGPCGDLCNTCSCGGSVTTTTGSGQTTSTAPGGTTSSTTPSITTTSTTSPPAGGADLLPIGFSATGTAPAHANVIIGYTVKNQGSVTAVAPWYDYILFSTDQTFGGDTAIGVFQRLSNLGSGGQYNDNGAQTVTVPNVAAGTYYLYFQTDGANAVAEGNESNNWTGPIAINVTNADLSPTALTIPASGTINTQISVMYSIKNLSGTVPAYGPWNDQLYLSADATLGAGDTLIGSFSQPGVAANTTYTLTQSVTIPSGVTPGTYYVILRTDGADDLHETNESNNVRVSSTTMTVS